MLDSWTVLKENESQMLLGKEIPLVTKLALIDAPFAPATESKSFSNLSNCTLSPHLVSTKVMNFLDRKAHFQKGGRILERET